MDTTQIYNLPEISQKQFPFFFGFLLFQYRLKQFSTSNFRDCTVTCYQTPLLKDVSLLESPTPAMQHSSSSFVDAGVNIINPSNKLHPDHRFPPSLFPQLDSLKREIRYKKYEVTTAMDPIDWESGKRANRPFEIVNSDWLTILHSISPRSCPDPQAPVRRPSSPRQSAPETESAYYREQSQFYNQLPAEDPFAIDEPATARPSGPLAVLVFAVLSYILLPLAPLSRRATHIVSNIRWVLRTGPLGLLSPMVDWIKGHMPGRENLFCLVVAMLLVRLMPGLPTARGVEETWPTTPPLYTIFIPNRAAIGTGAVVQSGGV